MYGVMGFKDLGCNNQVFDDFFYRNSRYKDVISETGGHGSSLCAEDMGDQLVSIGKDILRRMLNDQLVP